MTLKVTLNELENRYKELKQKLGKVPKRKELPYKMKYQSRCGMSWRQFVSHMGDIPINSGYTKDELKKFILDFNANFGRPPSSDEMKRPSSKVFQNMFGTWNNALAECGFEVSHPIYISDDGHKCYSRMELYVDNFLFHNKIEHEKDVKYPFHKKLNINTKKSCDWKTSDDKYIELFGLMRKNNYANRKEEKEELCKEFGLNLISLFPEDLKRLELKVNLATGA